MTSKKDTFPILVYLLALFSYIAASLFIRATTLDSLNLSFYRFFASCLALFPFAIIYRKEFDLVTIIISFFSGFFMSYGSIAWVIAIRETSIASADIIISTWAFVAIFLSAIVFKTRPSRLVIISLFVAALGLAIMILGQRHSTYTSGYGNFLAFVSGCFYAFYIIAMYKIKGTTNPFALLFWCSLGASTSLFLVMVLFYELSFPTTGNDYFSILMLALVMQIGGIGLTTYATKKLPVLTISLLSLLQPIFAAMLGFFVFDEHLSFLEVVGISITLLSLFIPNLDKMNKVTLSHWKRGRKLRHLQSQRKKMHHH